MFKIIISLLCLLCVTFFSWASSFEKQAQVALSLCSNTHNGIMRVSSIGELSQDARCLKHVNNKYHISTPVTVQLSNTIDINYQPITAFGSISQPFVGTFNGQGHSIAHLANQLFIATAKKSNIENLTITDMHLVTHGINGGLVGQAAGTAKNISISGDITCSSEYCGGYAGTMTAGSTAQYVSSSVNLRSAYTNLHGIGGLIGRLYGNLATNTSVYQCYSTGNITLNHGITIVNAGGLVGEQRYLSQVSISYATGNIDNPDAVPAALGGLVGSQDSDSEIRNSYAVGNVSDNAWFHGGLVGKGQACVDSFYNNVNTGNCGEAESVANLKLEKTFTRLAWDFSHNWKIDAQINSGYPYLSSNKPGSFQNRQ